MKKFLVVALSVLLMFAMFIPVMAEEAPSFTTAVSTDTVKRGETLTVTVSANKAFSAETIALDFASVCDPAAFELVEAKWTNAKVLLTDVDAAHFKAVGFCVDPEASPDASQPATGISGEIFKLTVRAKADAAYDSYNFKVSVNVDTAAANATGATVKVFNADLNGWSYEGGIWYYYEAGVKVTNAWRLDSIGWCWLTEDGSMAVKTFVKDSHGWAYVDESGYFYDTLTAWRLVDGVWYYVENGYSVRNAWRKDSIGWCWLTEDGSMATNTFVKDSAGWAYVDGSGYWNQSTGWLKLDDKWYYLQGGYSVRNQWRLDSIGWCWLTEDGSMAVKTFVKDSVGWAYVDEGGYFHSDLNAWRLLDGKWYYVENGYRVSSAWRLDSKGWCYLTAEGYMMTSSWLKDSVGWCYIDENGYCLANGTYTVDGHEYYFDANGRIEGEPITNA